MNAPIDENPYESPVDASAEVPEAGRVQELVAPGVKFFVGMFIGALFGGGFGVLGGVAACVVVHGLDDVAQVRGLLPFGFLFGGGFGIVLGGVVGMILGIVACCIRATSRSVLVGTSTFLSGSVGFGCGIWHPLAALCGLSAGVCGGWLLGKTLARMFWDSDASTPEPTDRH